MSDSDGEDAEAVRLGPEECDRLCNEFADITATNSLSARLKTAETKKKSKESASTSADKRLNVTKRIKVLSWNTDGIDHSEVESRASCLSDVIMRENPDVFLLQEVVEGSVKVFDDKLAEKFEMSYGNFGKLEGYFTAICLKKDSCVLESSSFQPFASSTMGRGLQVVEAKVHGVPVTLITSHLESLKDMTEERMRQLKVMFTTAKDVDISRIVFAGGDLNLRDPELEKVGGIPKGFGDAWEEAGKREVARWTWDMQRNDNLEMKGKWKPRTRFDRIYYRSAGDVTLKPANFELVGVEKTTPLRRFPSDHWGILFHVDLIPSTPVA